MKILKAISFSIEWHWMWTKDVYTDMFHGGLLGLLWTSVDIDFQNGDDPPHKSWYLYIGLALFYVRFLLTHEYSQTGVALPNSKEPLSTEES